MKIILGVNPYLTKIITGFVNIPCLFPWSSQNYYSRHTDGQILKLKRYRLYLHKYLFENII